MNQIPVLPAADLPELRRVIAAVATKRSSIKLGQRSYSDSFFSNSTAAWVVLIEAILAAYARRLGPDAIRTLEHREQVFEQMQVAYS